MREAEEDRVIDTEGEGVMEGEEEGEEVVHPLADSLLVAQEVGVWDTVEDTLRVTLPHLLEEGVGYSREGVASPLPVILPLGDLEGVEDVEGDQLPLPVPQKVEEMEEEELSVEGKVPLAAWEAVPHRVVDTEVVGERVGERVREGEVVPLRLTVGQVVMVGEREGKGEGE